MNLLRRQPILRQLLVTTGVLLIVLFIAAAWSGLRTRTERAVEVQTEAGTIATTAATVFDQYFASLDAMASALVRDSAVRSLDGSSSTRLFQSILAEQPLLGNISLRGPDGALVASAVMPATPSPAAPAVLLEALRTGRPAASQLVIGPILRRRTVQLGYPVKDDRGRVTGVLGFSLALTQLETLFARLPLPQGSVIVLADRNDVVISRSIDSEKYIGSSVDVPRDAATATTSQLDPDGVQRFHGNATIERGPWVLSVAIPRIEVLRRLTALWERNLSVITAVLVLIFGLAFWISWQTASDLTRLQLAAKKIASGDFSEPEQRPVFNLETAELQSSFVTMAARLREARDTVERQLAQERKMLEAVQTLQRQVVRQERLAAVGLLVSGVAHELNNPLQAILGSIELLERQPDVPYSVLEEIGFVKTQSHRARDIIRNLSRFSKQKPGPPSPVDLRDVIASVVQLRKRELDSASIALDVETSSVRKVLVSFAELEQVVLNFVVNAQQAIQGTGKTQGRILIRLTDAGKRVRLEVWDDGPGVPQDNEQKLFQPFFTTKPVGQGTGLGLSVSYGIVEAYGGATGYVNNAWGGATFFVELPIAEGERIADDRAAVLHGRVPSRV